MTQSIETLFTKESSSRFLEVNDILMQAMMANIDVALVDMPEILLRMKVAHSHSLSDLQEILNFVMNKLAKREGPCTSSAMAALYYFPEVFSKPRDEYVAAMLKEIAMHSGEGEDVEGNEQVCCYMGNVHMEPITRLWNTFNSDGVHSSQGGLEAEKKGKSVLLSKRLKEKKAGEEFTLDYVKLS